jgi:hypothetical protein
MPSDALRAWRSVRETVPWDAVPPVGPVTGGRDGFVHFVQTRVHTRDPLGAARLLAAMTQARDAATAGQPLSFQLLADWQQTVLGTPARWRSATAFAKGGRERYGHHAGIEAEFAGNLGQSDAPGLSLAARAVRSYLDVCYFHPFADGNARAAMLVMYRLLLRERVLLDQAGPLLTVSRHAEDAEGALAMAHLLHVLVTATGQRALNKAP